MEKKLWYFLIILLLLSSVLRFIYPTLTVYDHETVSFFEDSRKINEGENILYGYHKFETLGPALSYIHAGLFSISNNYLIHVIFVALLNVLAVVISFFFARKFFGKEVAIFSSLLYATSIWHLFYSRSLWNPNYLPFLVIVFFYSIFNVIIEKDYKYIMTSFLSFGLMLHFHLSILLLSPLFLFFIKLFKYRDFIKYFSCGIILFLITLLPIIMFSFSTGNNLLFQSLSYGFVQGKQNFLENTFEAIAFPFMLITPYTSKYFSGTENIYPGFFDILVIISIIILVFYFLYGLFSSFKRIRDLNYALLLSSFFIPIILYLIRNKNLSPHYYLISFPLGFIIVGLGIFEFFNKYRLKNLLYASFSYLIIVNLLIFSLTLVFLYNNGGTNGAYGILYKEKLEAAKFIESQNERNIIFYKHGNLGFVELFMMLNYDVNVAYINNFDELKNMDGIIILDSYSHIGYRDLTEQEKGFLYTNIIKNYNNKLYIIKI